MKTVKAIIIAIVVATLTILAFAWWHNSRERERVIQYVIADTEDPGDYIVSVRRASARTKEAPGARYYFVEMIDADEDYERILIRVDRDGIHDYSIQ